MCLLHRARVVCALVKKLSLPPYIHIGTGERFTEKLLRRLCGPGSRGSRETLCMYKLPPLNSAKGNALRNFLYFHANSLSLSLSPFAHVFFPFFFFSSSLPFTRRYKSVGRFTCAALHQRVPCPFHPAPFTFRYRFTVSVYTFYLPLFISFPVLCIFVYDASC